MEWVETTAKSVDEAKEFALDQLGVAADEAEFDVLEEPKSGLFGRVRGEARVRARVMPAAVRPKQDRRSRGKSKRDGSRSNGSGKSSASSTTKDSSSDSGTAPRGDADSNVDSPSDTKSSDTKSSDGTARSDQQQTKQRQPRQRKESKVSEEQHESTVTPQEVGDAAVEFMSGLATAFGGDPKVDLEVDGTELDVRVTGDELGLLIGPGGRTLIAVQDLARVASQRRLGDHDTRLRIDVAGYREKRRDALQKFASAVSAQVIESGTAKALEPMPSPDRKIVHDAVIEIDGVTSRSDGDDPMRRVIISPE